MDYLLINCFAGWSENGEKCQSMIREAQHHIFKFLFCSQPKYVQFTVTEEEGNQKIFQLILTYFSFKWLKLIIHDQNSRRLI